MSNKRWNRGVNRGVGNTTKGTVNLGMFSGSPSRPVPSVWGSVYTHPGALTAQSIGSSPHPIVTLKPPQSLEGGSQKAEGADMADSYSPGGIKPRILPPALLGRHPHHHHGSSQQQFAGAEPWGSWHWLVGGKVASEPLDVPPSLYLLSHGPSHSPSWLL